MEGAITHAGDRRKPPSNEPLAHSWARRGGYDSFAGGGGAVSPCNRIPPPD